MSRPVANVEAREWNPEVDEMYQVRRKSNIKFLIILAAVVVVVAVVVSLVLFLPGKNDPTDLGSAQPPEGQTTVAEQTTLDPNDPVALGMSSYASGNYAEAITILDLAVAQKPESGDAYAFRGMSHFMQANYSSAIMDLTKALRYLGERSDLLTLRGQSYYLQAMYPEAGGDLTRAIELDPVNKNAYTYRAMVYDITGKPELAASDRLMAGGQ